MRTLTAWTIALSVVWPLWVHANPYDISLRGLGRPERSVASDPAVVRYRRLSSELVLALAPHPGQPAETLGMSGFSFAVESPLTAINSNAAHWQGQAGNPVFEGVIRGRDVPNVLWTPTFHVRKGLPISAEIGVSGSYLAFSEMFMLGGEFKLALHESYLRWFPAVSTRLAFSRLFGSSDLDILAGEADLMMSLPFGIGGMAQLTPFLGAGLLFAHVNSQVIDETPNTVVDPNDQRGGPGGSLYTFPTLDWKDNRATRFFGGLRFIAAFVELTYELDFGLTPVDKEQILTHILKIGFDV